MDYANQLTIERSVKLHRGYHPQEPLCFEVACTNCRGRGWFAYDMMASDTYPCDDCKGTGITKDAFTP